MAHELTINNDVAEMAYVGETPWHGLGQQLPDNASVDEMRNAAGMNWTINSAPVMYNPRVDSLPAWSVYSQVADRKVLFRSDNDKPLSVVGSKYKVVQPAEVLEFFRDLVESGGFKLNTAGTLFGGRKLWALAEIGEKAKIRGMDEIGGYLLLATSCDGTMATSGRLTTVRVVCNNTLNVATTQGKTCISIPHSTKFDHAAMKKQLGIASNAFERFMVDVHTLADKQIDSMQADAILCRLYSDERDTIDDIRELKQYKSIIELFNGKGKGSNLETAKDTAWGLVNAVTEYYDFHNTARTDDARLNSAWFGGAAKRKEDVMQIALTV